MHWPVLFGPGPRAPLVPSTRLKCSSKFEHTDALVKYHNALMKYHNALRKYHNALIKYQNALMK